MHGPSYIHKEVYKTTHEMRTPPLIWTLWAVPTCPESRRVPLYHLSLGSLTRYAMFGATSVTCSHKTWFWQFNARIHMHVVCAGTHGSGITYNNIAAMVTKLKLINGEGMILTLSARNNEDIFKAAQVYYCKEIALFPLLFPGLQSLPAFQ